MFAGVIAGHTDDGNGAVLGGPMRTSTRARSGEPAYPDGASGGGESDGEEPGVDEPERANGNRTGDPELNEQDVEDTLERTVTEGRRRLHRRWAPLVATGLVGGVDVGTGVLAMLVVEAKTGDKLLAGLAFSIGFVALTMARSELFTEDFLVPVVTVIARQARLRSLMRLWVVTAGGNLVGGWVFTLLVVTGFSQVAKPAVEAGDHYIKLGLGWRAFALALLGGAVITLMTWMQHGTESLAAKVIPAVTTGFLLAGLQLNHAIVNSLLIFSGLHTHHSPYGYLQWAETAGWAALGNMLGGVALVTLLRVMQVPHTVREHADNPAPCVDDS
jgi:formate/nitrite transporter FocA (FNT family)